jgi:hypothetical protein
MNCKGIQGNFGGAKDMLFILIILMPSVVIGFSLPQQNSSGWVHHESFF